MWRVLVLDQVARELRRLPSTERGAVENAMKKLEALGPDLRFPHSSDVRGAQGVRELRPRAGRCPWRAFYRRFGDVYVLASIGPEAQVDPQGFKRAVAEAEKRLNELETD